MVNNFFYLFSSLIYETNQQFQIFRKIYINNFNFYKTKNLKESFKKKKLSKYYHKSEYKKHLGTYTKFYSSNLLFYKIKQYYTTSVIFNHKFLTSKDVKILKQFCLLKKIYWIILNYNKPKILIDML